MGDAIRTALGDRSLVLMRAADPGTWIGEDGAHAVLPAPGEGRAVTLVGREDEPLAAIVHDPALLEQPELLEAVVRVLRLALENERLESQLREQLQAVTESRERIVTAAEDERRRLERDLHDGAQQRLIGVMLALQQARATADADSVPEALREQLDNAASETTEAINELRELARGIHPAILEDEGLGAAVAALARRAGIPVDVRLDLDGRLPRLVESTAYFTIAEALTNTQRHARASHATVRVAHAGDALELEVSDDGQGGADAARGSGLQRARRPRDGRGRPARGGQRGRRRHAHPSDDPDVMNQLRAIVADDSVVIRQGVARILAEGGFRVTAEARDATELLEAVAAEPPHLAVVDIRMPPGGNAGLAAALTIRERFPTVGVLVLSQFLEPEYALRLLGAGVDRVGYLLKDRLGETRELLDAAHRVAAGGSAVDPAVIAELVKARRRDDRLTRLTDREREALGRSRRATRTGRSPSGSGSRRRRSRG